MTPRWLRCLVLVASWMLQGTAFADEPLVVVPDTSEVDITTDFTGTDVKTVGSMRGPADLVIKLVGPPEAGKLWRETKIGPFWVEGETAKVAGAPSLLFLYATAPIAEILPLKVREQYGLVFEDVPVRIEPQLQFHVTDDWHAAFLRIKERQHYYHEDDKAIRVFGNRLFIADMRLPGDLQTGTYTVETLVVKSGKVVGHTVGKFEVRLSGLERWVWTTAHDRSWLFGSLFTLLAMLLGFALNAIPYGRRT
jgi:uncharacterized protein (TIGR02186 family)